MNQHQSSEAASLMMEEGHQISYMTLTWGALHPTSKCVCVCVFERKEKRLESDVCPLSPTGGYKYSSVTKYSCHKLQRDIQFPLIHPLT